MSTLGSKIQKAVSEYKKDPGNKWKSAEKIVADYKRIMDEVTTAREAELKAAGINISLLQMKKLYLQNRHKFNESLGEVVEWLSNNDELHDEKIWCINHHNPSLFSSPIKQFEWLIKDSLESPLTNVEPDGGWGHH